MLERNPIENENSVSVQKHNIAITAVSNVLKIELPSFEEIENFKNQDIDEINIISENSHDALLLEISKHELANLIRHEELLNGEDKYKYRVASLYKDIGDFENEYKMLNEIKDIENKPFYFNQLAKNILKKDTDSGLELLKKSRSLNSFLNISLAYLQEKQFEKSLSFIRDAYDIYGCNYKINLTYALISIVFKDYKVSIRLLKELIREDRLDDNICYMLSLSYFLNDDLVKSTKYAFIGLNLNNFNRELLLLYSHLCRINKDFNIIPYLEKYLKIKDDAIAWEQLARFKYFQGKFADALKPLKMLLVLNDKNPSTWNNLALTYQKLNESENKILKCYLKALENFNKSENLIIAGNFLNFLNKNKKYSEIIEIYDSLNLNHIENRELFSKNFSIQEIYLRALRKLNKFDDYIKVAKDLYNITTDKTNRVFILNDLVFVYSTDLYSYDMIIKYSTELENCISSVENKEIQMKILNNVIFSKLETDQFISHDKLNYFRSHLDRNPFYNATYGLFCLKNKNIQKGVNLYNKAIGFAYSEDLKDKLRVKKNLEIGKAYISLNSFQTAKYYLEKVIKNTKYSYYKDQAERIISENIIK